MTLRTLLVWAVSLLWLLPTACDYDDDKDDDTGYEQGDPGPGEVDCEVVAEHQEQVPKLSRVDFSNCHPSEVPPNLTDVAMTDFYLGEMRGVVFKTPTGAPYWREMQAGILMMRGGTSLPLPNGAVNDVWVFDPTQLRFDSDACPVAYLGQITVPQDMPTTAGELFFRPGQTLAGDSFVYVGGVRRLDDGTELTTSRIEVYPAEPLLTNRTDQIDAPTQVYSMPSEDLYIEGDGADICSDLWVSPPIDLTSAGCDLPESEFDEVYDALLPLLGLPVPLELHDMYLCDDVGVTASWDSDGDGWPGPFDRDGDGNPDIYPFGLPESVNFFGADDEDPGQVGKQTTYFDFRDLVDVCQETPACGSCPAAHPSQPCTLVNWDDTQDPDPDALAEWRYRREGRLGFHAAYDPVSDSVLAFGGYTGCVGSSCNVARQYPAGFDKAHSLHDFGFDQGMQFSFSSGTAQALAVDQSRYGYGGAALMGLEWNPVSHVWASSNSPSEPRQMLVVGGWQAREEGVPNFKQTIRWADPNNPGHANHRREQGDCEFDYPSIVDWKWAPVDETKYEHWPRPEGTYAIWPIGDSRFEFEDIPGGSSCFAGTVDSVDVVRVAPSKAFMITHDGETALMVWDSRVDRYQFRVNPSNGHFGDSVALTNAVQGLQLAYEPVWGKILSADLVNGYFYANYDAKVSSHPPALVDTAGPMTGVDACNPNAPAQNTLTTETTTKVLPNGDIYVTVDMDVMVQPTTRRGIQYDYFTGVDLPLGPVGLDLATVEGEVRETRTNRQGQLFPSWEIVSLPSILSNHKDHYVAFRNGGSAPIEAGSRIQATFSYVYPAANLKTGTGEEIVLRGRPGVRSFDWSDCTDPATPASKCVWYVPSGTVPSVKVVHKSDTVRRHVNNLLVPDGWTAMPARSAAPSLVTSDGASYQEYSYELVIPSTVWSDTPGTAESLWKAFDVVSPSIRKLGEMDVRWDDRCTTVGDVPTGKVAIYTHSAVTFNGSDDAWTWQSHLAGNDWMVEIDAIGSLLSDQFGDDRGSAQVPQQVNALLASDYGTINGEYTSFFAPPGHIEISHWAEYGDDLLINSTPTTLYHEYGHAFVHPSFTERELGTNAMSVAWVFEAVPDLASEVVTPADSRPEGDRRMRYYNQAMTRFATQESCTLGQVPGNHYQFPGDDPIYDFGIGTTSLKLMFQQAVVQGKATDDSDGFTNWLRAWAKATRNLHPQELASDQIRWELDPTIVDLDPWVSRQTGTPDAWLPNQKCAGFPTVTVSDFEFAEGPVWDPVNDTSLDLANKWMAGQGHIALRQTTQEAFGWKDIRDIPVLVHCEADGLLPYSLYNQPAASSVYLTGCDAKRAEFQPGVTTVVAPSLGTVRFGGTVGGDRRDIDSALNGTIGDIYSEWREPQLVPPSPSQVYYVQPGLVKFNHLDGPENYVSYAYTRTKWYGSTLASQDPSNEWTSSDSDNVEDSADCDDTDPSIHQRVVFPAPITGQGIGDVDYDCNCVAEHGFTEVREGTNPDPWTSAAFFDCYLGY